jgi:cytosine/adenosine deaminase-related metal-dependent hydrolase
VTTVQGVLHDAAVPATYVARVGSVVAVLVEAGIRSDVMVGLTDQAEYAPPGLLDPETEASLRVAVGTGADELSGVVHALAGRWQGDGPGGLVRIGVAPVAPQWSSDALLRATAQLVSEGVRVHTHLLESPAQRRWLPEAPVDRLRRAGLLGPWLSVAHGVWLDDAELAELTAAGVSVVHCPTSNVGLEVGAARVRAWWDAGLVPALATDSHPREGRLDMFAEMRCALETAAGFGAPLTASQVLAMATQGGAAAVGRSDHLGEIGPGRAADLLTLDLPVTRSSSAVALADAVVAGDRAQVAGVHVAGRPAVRDGRLETADQVDAAGRRVLAQIEADAEARRRRQTDAAERDARVLDALRRAGLPVGAGARP